MIRLFLILLALASTFVVDSMVYRHCVLASYEGMEQGLSSYERYDTLHMFHRSEEWALGIAFLCCVFTLNEKIARFGILKTVCKLSLIAAIATGGLCLFLDLIAHGTEGQYGVELPFWYSSNPLLILDALAVLSAILLLFIGPPRSWTGDEELSWL